MIATQNKNWEIIEEQFEIFRSNLHILQDCNQMLFSNQQLNFNYDTVASMLSIIYSDVKSYRSALYSFRLNVINSIPSLLKKHLPMSLVPRESLLAILESVAREQSTAKDRFFSDTNRRLDFILQFRTFARRSLDGHGTTDDFISAINIPTNVNNSVRS